MQRRCGARLRFGEGLSVEHDWVIGSPTAVYMIVGRLTAGMRRYYVQTFGCQMNVHDSERVKGLLESLGMGEAAEPDEADLLVFNTCTIREKADERLVAHLMDARAAKRRDPDKVIAVGGCWSESMRDEVFELYPFVDLAFGPGAIHVLGEYVQAGGEIRPRPLRDVRPLRRTPAIEAGAPVPGLDADLPGLQLDLQLLHRAVRARAGAEPARRRPGRRGNGPGRRRRRRADPARPERQLLGPRPAGRRADRLR